MATEEERAILDERLVVWKGPLEFDIGVSPERLASFLKNMGAGTVLVDSLKRCALDLVKDEVGSRVNAAYPRVLVEDIEVAVNHHQRKGQGERKPKSLDDVYGSGWLSAGTGSVCLLRAQAGGPVVEFKHLKQPASPIRPSSSFTITIMELPLWSRAATS
jgi:hypothetical protein